MSEEDLDLPTYLKVNTSTDLPSLIRKAAVQGNYDNNSDWVRDVICTALAEQGVIGHGDVADLLRRQPHWGNGKGATSPEYIARRYGRPVPGEGGSAGSGNKSSEKVSQDG